MPLDERPRAVNVMELWKLHAGCAEVQSWHFTKGFYYAAFAFTVRLAGGR